MPSAYVPACDTTQFVAHAHRAPRHRPRCGPSSRPSTRSWCSPSGTSRRSRTAGTSSVVDNAVATLDIIRPVAARQPARAARRRGARRPVGGLPVGVQVVGDRYREDLVLDAAAGHRARRGRAHADRPGRRPRSVGLDPVPWPDWCAASSPSPCPVGRPSSTPSAGCGTTATPRSPSICASRPRLVRRCSRRWLPRRWSTSRASAVTSAAVARSSPATPWSWPPAARPAAPRVSCSPTMRSRRRPRPPAPVSASTADDHWLACLPLAHVGGLSVVTRALATGTPLTVLPGFDADAVTAAARAGATLVSLVATALARIDPRPVPADRAGRGRPRRGPAGQRGHHLRHDRDRQRGRLRRPTARRRRGPHRTRRRDRPARDRCCCAATGTASTPRTGEGWLATGDLGACGVG